MLQPGEGPTRGFLRDCENRWICSSIYYWGLSGRWVAGLVHGYSMLICILYRSIYWDRVGLRDLINNIWLDQTIEDHYNMWGQLVQLMTIRRVYTMTWCKPIWYLFYLSIHWITIINDTMSWRRPLSHLRCLKHHYSVLITFHLPVRYRHHLGLGSDQHILLSW